MMDQDDGMTLVETLVSMIVFSIIAAITTATVLNLTQLTRLSAEASANAFDARYATSMVSRDVRNIDRIYTPGVVGDNWYAEYCTYGKRENATGAPQGECVQWRLQISTGNLDMRRVPRSGPGCSDPTNSSGWISLAHALHNDADDPPLEWIANEFEDEPYRAEIHLVVQRDTVGTDSVSTFRLPNNQSAPQPHIGAACHALERN